MSSLPVVGQVDCIVIEGADARRFAQTQFSGDVARLTPGHWQWNAWLTPQGRVQALMHLADAGDGCLLAVLRGGNPQSVLAGLTRYLLRANVTMTARTFAVRAGGPMEYGAARLDHDSRVLGYGARSLRLDPAAPEAVADTDARNAWRLTDIMAGWPDLPSDSEPRFLPPALGLEHLGAVAFEKGCYPGQEIAARLHYRGGHKRRLCHITGAAPLPPGAIRTSDGAISAVILATARDGGDFHLLAVLDANTTRDISDLSNNYTIDEMFEP